jgi:hypothetical protein
VQAGVSLKDAEEMTAHSEIVVTGRQPQLSHR